MVEKFVTVATYSDPLKARLDSSRLAIIGITAYIEGEESGTALIGVEAGSSSIKLNVAEDVADRARELLAEARLAEADAANPTEPDEIEPPEDLESNDYLIERAWRASLLGLFLFPPFLHCYSLWTIIRVVQRDEDLSESTSRKMYMALALDGAVLVGVAVICSGVLWVW